MRTTRSMQPTYNRHTIGMQTSVATAVQVPAKEVPTEYLGNTLVLEYPTQVLEIAVVDRYSIKIDLEVRTVYKTKDRPSFKIRVLLLLVLALHAVRLSPVALHTHDTTLVMSSVMEQSFCGKSAVRA